MTTNNAERTSKGNKQEQVGGQFISAEESKATLHTPGTDTPQHPCGAKPQYYGVMMWTNSFQQEVKDLEDRGLQVSTRTVAAVVCSDPIRSFGSSMGTFPIGLGAQTICILVGYLYKCGAFDAYGSGILDELGVCITCENPEFGEYAIEPKDPATFDDVACAKKLLSRTYVDASGRVIDLHMADVLQLGIQVPGAMFASKKAATLWIDRTLFLSVAYPEVFPMDALDGVVANWKPVD